MVVPTHFEREPFVYSNTAVCAIIPTYKPGALTVRLVEDLVRWNPLLRLYVVDDCTPASYPEVTRIFERIAAVSPAVTMLRTPTNALKAGALNYALGHIFGPRGGTAPHVVITLDDDVVIEPQTIQNLVSELLAYKHLGAVCSQCRVLNKNKNLLTRLQGLEYLGFNAIRLADEGFIRGPLVMHGMLTAFRAKALRQVNGFTEGHLIEDYEITTRLKAEGWSVKAALNAPAWTLVPENLLTLWRQRTRWSYGGVMVVAGARYWPGVFQDMLGHGMFFATLLMLGVLLLSKGNGYIPPLIAYSIVVLSLLQFGVWYLFQLWLLRLYPERDHYDWILRASLLPEFVYSYLMTAALLGSYLFLGFNTSVRTLARSWQTSARIAPLGSRLFRACGYTEGWGTRVG